MLSFEYALTPPSPSGSHPWNIKCAPPFAYAPVVTALLRLQNKVLHFVLCAFQAIRSQLDSTPLPPLSPLVPLSVLPPLLARHMSRNDSCCICTYVQQLNCQLPLIAAVTAPPLCCSAALLLCCSAVTVTVTRAICCKSLVAAAMQNAHSCPVPLPRGPAPCPVPGINRCKRSELVRKRNPSTQPSSSPVTQCPVPSTPVAIQTHTNRVRDSGRVRGRGRSKGRGQRVDASNHTQINVIKK